MFWHVCLDGENTKKGKVKRMKCVWKKEEKKKKKRRKKEEKKKKKNKFSILEIRTKKEQKNKDKQKIILVPSIT